MIKLLVTLALVAGACAAKEAPSAAGTITHTCPPGSFAHRDGCTNFTGQCAHGTLVSQAMRTQQDHCGACDLGYTLVNKMCVAFQGSCTNGKLIALARRQTDNHCGACDQHFHLSGSVGVPLADSVGGRSVH